MRVLFLFLDGVGLGDADPQSNPFARAELTTLHGLLGSRLVRNSGALHKQLASLLPLDACLGIPGLPQSASGQAALLTGKNIPAFLEMHYGPKPNPAIAAHLAGSNLFSTVLAGSKTTALLNAFPLRYFDGLDSGKHLPGAIAMAARLAGLKLRRPEDLHAGNALSADFTGKGWRESLGYRDAPIYTPHQAGEMLGTLAQALDLAFFEYWVTDYIGHKQDMLRAVEILDQFDQVIAGLLTTWNIQEDLILITSDHGNLEDLSTRRHTRNPVPAILIGSEEHRRKFSANLVDLTGITPAILAMLAL